MLNTEKKGQRKKKPNLILRENFWKGDEEVTDEVLKNNRKISSKSQSKKYMDVGLEKVFLRPPIFSKKKK